MQKTRFIIAFTLTVLDVAAHGPLHERLDAASAELRQQPQRADLYLRRGELHRQHRNWRAALADYGSAARLDPNLIEVDLMRARMLIDAGMLEETITRMESFLLRNAGHPEALLLRAEAHERSGNWRAAALDYSWAASGATDPALETYVAAARAWDRAGEPAVAVECLNTGLERLGPIPVLQLAAIDLDRKLGRWDAALARIDMVASVSKRKEKWLLERGAVLRDAGRHDEAQKAFERALQMIQSLPAAQRHTKATLSLERQLRSSVLTVSSR